MQELHFNTIKKQIALWHLVFVSLKEHGWFVLNTNHDYQLLIHND
jgi:hypothetical protein